MVLTGLSCRGSSLGGRASRRLGGFGRALARMHGAAMPSFGAPSDGYIGSLPLPNASYGDWPTFYVENRINPYLDALRPAQRRPVEAVC